MYSPRLTAAFAVLVLAGLCPAPIKDVQPHFQPQVEQSQEQRAAQQSSVVAPTVGEVGVVPTRTTDNGYAAEKDSGQTSARALVSQVRLSSDEKASQIVASAHVEESGSNTTKFVLGAGILVVGFGGVWALRFWKPGGFAPR